MLWLIPLRGPKTGGLDSLLNDGLTVCLHVFMANCGSGNQACAHALSVTMNAIYKTESNSQFTNLARRLHMHIYVFKLNFAKWEALEI